MSSGYSEANKDGTGASGNAEGNNDGEFRDATEGNNRDDGPSTSGSGPAGNIWRVGVRVPPFWPEEPEVWFAQIESQFELSNITADSTKFNFVAAQLDQECARTMKDVLINPPKTGKYEKLKTELFKRTSISREKKTLQLIQHEEMGDRKPSQFLRLIRDLAGPDIPDDFIRTIWVSRLPPNVQTVVASQYKQSLDDVADLADRIHELALSSPQVASTVAPANMPGSALEARVAELTRQVESLLQVQTHPNSRSRSKTRFYRRGSGARSHSRNRSRERPEGHPFCWYHFEFGNRATRCKQPCNFKTSGN